MRGRTVSLLGAAVLLAGMLPGQINKPEPIPNNTSLYGSHVIEVQKVLSPVAGYTVNGCLGVCYDWKNKAYYVSARRNTASTSNPHKLFKIEYDSTSGKWDKVTQYDQPTAINGSSWGMRDLAYDFTNEVVYGGCETTHSGGVVFGFNTKIGAWDGNFAWKTPAPVTTARALAYNWRKKTMWTADFSSAHWEFDKGGNLLNTVPNIQPASYGAGYDQNRQTVLWFGQSGWTGTGICQVLGKELDTQTTPPAATGVAFIGDTAIPGGTNPGGLAGGMDWYIDPATNRPVMVCLTQATNDTIYTIYGRFQYGVPPSDGVFTMNGQYPGSPPGSGNPNFGFEVRNSTAASVILFIGAKQSPGIQLVGGLFRPGSELNLQLFPVTWAVAPVNSGLAKFPLPLPPGLNYVDTYWQCFGVHATPPLISTTEGGEVSFKTQ